ncbi:hypothetical protein BDZ89DRAFT_1045406 [Hymenopellis radicata]|nr:hypothetical protein BDZ89DRAFT_1045406 [Hymenopellis radicata]
MSRQHLLAALHFLIPCDIQVQPVVEYFSTRQQLTLLCRIPKNVYIYVIPIYVLLSTLDSNLMIGHGLLVMFSAQSKKLKRVNQIPALKEQQGRVCRKMEGSPVRPWQVIAVAVAIVVLDGRRCPKDKYQNTPKTVFNGIAIIKKLNYANKWREIEGRVDKHNSYATFVE